MTSPRVGEPSGCEERSLAELSLPRVKRGGGNSVLLKFEEDSTGLPRSFLARNDNYRHSSLLTPHSSLLTPNS
ncbi:MAG: hypothetical protein IJL44_04525 [Bacteroidales bacterium]|nr:hypothetical protein [Bacteroidales bacterium]